MFVDARDINSSEDLIARGNEKLSQTMPTVNFDCVISDMRPFVYGTDWDLGDIVTIKSKKLNVSMQKLIEEVTEFYTENGFTLKAVFGSTVKGIKEYVDSNTDYAIE